MNLGNLEYDIEYRIMTKWGYRWFHDYAHCTYNENGIHKRWDGVIFDISDAKKMNTNMGSIPLSFNFLKESNIGLWAFELDEGCAPRMYGDEAMMHLIGINTPSTPEEIYHAWYDHIDKKHYEEIEKSIDKMISGIHSEVQYPWHAPNGQTRIVRCGGIRNSKYTKGIRLEGVHRDVTKLIHYEKKLQEQIQDSQKIIQGLIDECNFACRVNLSNDSFSIFKMDKNMLGYGIQFDTFTQAYNFFVSNVVFEPDKTKMYKVMDFETIRKKIETTPFFSVYYRSIINHVSIWHEMTIKKLNNDQIAIGFSPKNQEIIQQKILNQINNEYYALFSLDLDTWLMTVLKSAPWYTLVKEGESIEISKALNFFLKDINAEPQGFFKNFSDKSKICKLFEKEDKTSFTYLSSILNKWINVSVYVIYRHDDGTAASISMGFSFVNSSEREKQKMQKQLKENMEIIGGFTSEYYALYYINLQNNTFKIYSQNNSIHPLSTQIISEKSEPFKFLRKFANALKVHPDDKKIIDNITKEKLKDILKNKKKYTIHFRIDYGNGFKWSAMDIVKIEKDNEEPNAITIGFAECDKEIRREQAFMNSLAILRKDYTPNNAIHEQLGLLGDFYESNKVHVFEFSKNKDFIQSTYSWHSPDILSIKDDFQILPTIYFNPWIKEFEKNHKIIISSIKKDIHLTKEQIQFLENKKINDVIAVPLMKENELKGFIVLENPNLAESNMDLLQTAASIIFSEILRRKENDEEHITLSKLTDAFLSVYYVDLATDYMRTWKIDKTYKEDFGTTRNYSKSMGNYVQNFIVKQDRERCKKMTSPAYILEQFKTKDLFSVEMTDIYTGTEINIVFDFIKVSEDGNQFVICTKDVTESLKKQKEHQEKLTQALFEAKQANKKVTHQKKLIHYFLQPYRSAYSVDLINDTFETHSTTHESDDPVLIGGTKHDMNNFILKHVHVDDQELIFQLTNKEYLIERLKKEDFISFTMREIFGSQIKTIRGIIIRGIDEYHVSLGFMDITDELHKERKQQERLQEALSMAQSANRAKTTFLNNMSHDIRTPMNAIIGYTKLASDHIDNKDKVTDYLGKINQSSSHLLSLINDVLDMSRIESGKMNIEEKDENIEDIIQTLKSIVQTDVQIKKQNLSVDLINIKNAYVICDKLRLTQVLLNVLSNSIKYTNEGGSITIQIEQINNENNFGTFEFIIKDNGMGMSKEFLKTIYDPFTRVKSSTVSGIQGTGLGMSITKKIVDMMGGSIQIQSEINKGTEVKITFDFKISNLQNKINSININYDFTGKKILLVEDNAFNREIATELLEDCGFIVSTATDGDIAIDIIQHAQPDDFDLILMDIQMPAINGYESTKIIRTLGTKISQIPIIAMTANAFEEDRQKALAVGMNEHIAKPINLKELQATIAKVLF